MDKYICYIEYCDFKVLYELLRCCYEKSILNYVYGNYLKYSVEEVLKGF